jgi:hypothetical protein
VLAVPALLACTGEEGTPSVAPPPGDDSSDELPDEGNEPGSRDPSAASDACAASGRVAPRLYRLSATQYANALQDLLELAAPPVVAGDTEATLLFYPREDAPVQSSMAEGFSRASRESLTTADLTQMSGCSPDAADAIACAQAFVESFASRAFRRPLDEADRAALITGPASPFAVGSQLDANNGMRLALEAVLNAPSFVYRRELGEADGRLSSLETAEQLGFLLRNSLPDDELWQAALADELVTNEQIGAQVDRMLLDPAVQANVTRIVGAWFGADRVNQVSKDPVAFPGFNEDALGSALFESSRLFIDDALWGQPQGLPGLLQSPTIFLNASLAEA